MVYGSEWAPVVQIWVLAARNSPGPSVCLCACCVMWRTDRNRTELVKECLKESQISKQILQFLFYFFILPQKTSPHT